MICGHLPGVRPAAGPLSCIRRPVIDGCEFLQAPPTTNDITCLRILHAETTDDQCPSRCPDFVLVKT